MTKDKKKMHRLFLYVGALILFIILAVLIFTQNKKNQDTKIVACTQEAKLCPDGSSVYRFGPQCNFADCPVAPEPKIEEEQVVKEEVLGSKYTTLNKKVVIAGMTVTPLEVVEDSRCPSGVNCIWKGTVRLKVRLESEGNTTQTPELSFGNSVVFGDKKITLVTVNPAAVSNLIINKKDYVFEFSVSNNSKQLLVSGILDGTMTIGPICPVERVDNPCKPTPEMFAQKKIGVYQGDDKKLIKTLTPDKDGRFKTTLPAGVYYVELINPVLRPATVLGVPATVTIQKNATFHMDINIDTGIR